MSESFSIHGPLVLIYFKRYFKEAEVYLLRFQQCMTRAMTLIKMNFVGSLRALSSEVVKRLSEKVARSLILVYFSLIS